MKNPAETRFVELMAELFQLDEAEALDFGLYRIIRRHNQEVRAILGEVTANKDGKTLNGGRLSALMDEAFVIAGDEAKAEDQWRIKELEEQLSIKPGMTASERAALLDTLEKVPATAQQVREYRSRIQQKTSAASVHSDRAEVLNRLYQFFARHYQDGDFIVERRYGRGGISNRPARTPNSIGPRKTCTTSNPATSSPTSPFGWRMAGLSCSASNRNPCKPPAPR